MHAMQKYLGNPSHAAEPSGYREAVKDLLAAIKAGDEEAAAEALEAAIYECQMAGDKPAVTVELG